LQISADNSFQALAEEFNVRKSIYSLLGSYFYQPLSAEELGKIIDQNPFEDLAEMELSGYFGEGIVLLSKFFRENSGSNLEQLTKRLKEEFYRLFIGPGPLVAPPYESVYLGKEKIIFDIQTLQIRDCYRAWGLEVEKKYKEPDDHIGIELQFMAYLIEQAISLANQPDKFLENLLDQQFFLSQHILAFGPQFFQRVIDKSLEDFYRGLSFLAYGFIYEDQSYLAQLLKEWEPYFKKAKAM